ncbi:hypothetical protein Tco_1043666 [Tanacetum coccineum]|uniref:Uncharacterized protein n=1 Tax=Tanacetum coccineum TaxID=301880 RepID=A0ABQ5GMR8_9ASTR
MSKMDDDLFTYEVKIDEVTNIPCDIKKKTIRNNNCHMNLMMIWNMIHLMSNLLNDALTKDIEGFKTYEDYKDDWIYEWNKDVPWVHEKPWADDGAWKELALVVHYLNCLQDAQPESTRKTLVFSEAVLSK